MELIRGRGLHVPKFPREISRNLKKLAVVLLAAMAISFHLERLVANVFYDRDTFFFGRYAAVFVSVELLALLFCFREIVAVKVEIAAFVVILSVGSLYAVALPAFCGIAWDDEVHYFHTMLMSHAFDPGITEAEDFYLKGYRDMALGHKYYDRESQQEMYQKVDRLNGFKKSGSADREYPRYRILCYVPAAFGLWLGKALSLPYPAEFMLGRWCSLVFYAIMSFLAIRKLKSGKVLASVIALIPFQVFMASSYSYDTWLTVWFLYGFCCYFGVLQQPDKKMSLKDWGCMVFSFFIGAGPKVLYIPMIFLILFLPKEKFASPRQRKWMYLAVACVTVLVSIQFAHTYLFGADGIAQDKRGGEGVNAAGQIAYIFAHPWEYTKILLKTLAEYLSPQASCQYMSYLHYFSGLKPTAFSTLYVVLLAVVAITDKDICDTNIRILSRVVTLLLAFGVLCLAATSMYVAFTEVGNGKIMGYQYRYIAPLLFPALYVLGSGRVKNHVRREYYNGIALAICAFVSIHAVWAYAINLY